MIIFALELVYVNAKSVKLFVDCLLMLSGSGKYLFYQISTNSSRFESVNLSILSSVEIYQISTA